MAAQTLTVKLFRGDNTSWGFRLQGGKDFSAPISVQRVNPGSLAENAGLMTGDAILKIQGRNADGMRHKEAQDTIISAGNNIEIIVQRGGVRVWKPTVTPIGDIPVVATPQSPGIYTQTSLAAKKQDFTPIGSKHNVSARPFAPVGGGKVLVNNQYNTPAPLYSMNNIAETLSAHTEVLASGAKGINFMKEEPPVNKESAVYRMIMEEKSGATTDGFNHVEQAPYRKDSPTIMPQVNLKHVSAPITKPRVETEKPLASNACPECGKAIIGVFVRIKDKNLHPECFRCSTCGTSLKNIGYFNVNDKLYCDSHAKLAAKIASTMPTFEPLIISQQQDKPTATSPTPLTPGAGPLSPSTYRSVSPVPFHRPGDVHHVNAPQSPQPMLSPPVFKSSAPGPTFGAPAAPASKVPTTPVAQMHQPPAPSLNTATTPGTGTGSKFVWPPQKTPVCVSSEPLLASTATPSLPTYRPPPGTQHAIPTPKYTNAPPKFNTPVSPPPPKFSSPLSPPPPKFTSPVSPPPFIVGGVKKVPPNVSPKPHSAVQSSKAQTWGVGSTMTTTASSALAGVSAGSRPAPRRGRGQLKQQVGAGTRIPICNMCGTPIRGPFVQALGKSWCPDHFTCANNRCQRSLTDIGFVENSGQLYCENCFEAHLAPICAKCSCRIKGDCLNALDKQWHPSCFLCACCHKPFGNSSFYMEDGLPYCEKDWNELFTTKCVGCGFPIEAGDRWVQALTNNYHSQCFKCTSCHHSLEGQSFYAKSGRPYCKKHAR